MDSKKEFYNIIWSYYKEIANGKIEAELLVGLSIVITDYYYEQYNRFRIQYPKSVKRYSTFQIKDLDHPTTFEMVINFFKDKLGNSYAEYSKILLKMSDVDLKAFEKNREDFHNMM